MPNKGVIEVSKVSHYDPDPQDSEFRSFFLERTEEIINCFQDLLTFS